MKIALVFAKIDELYDFEVLKNEHIGLAYLASMLKKYDFNYDIIDGHMFGYEIEDISNMIIENGYDLVGFSVLYSNFESTVKIITNVKRHLKNTKIVLGGQHVTFCAKEILKNSKDIFGIIRGKGEFTLVEVSKAIRDNRSFSEIDGFTYQLGNRIYENKARNPEPDLNKYELPSREILEKVLSEGLNSSLNIIASRGCCYNCSFCNGRTFFDPLNTKSWRCRNPKNIVDELNAMLIKYGNNEHLNEVVNFCDLNFINESKSGIIWLKELISEIKRRNLDFYFYILTRVDSIINQKELVKELHDIGLIQVEIGLEAGSQNELDVFNKKTSINQNVEAVNYLRNLHIDINSSGFITYHPYTTIKELRANSEFLNNINYWKIAHMFTKAALYPGSELTRRVKEDNLILPTFNHYRVYDYQFADERVELLFNKLTNALDYDILRSESETIQYIGYLCVLTYRRIEKLHLYTVDKLDEIFLSIESDLKYEIRNSKILIYNFFNEALDLANSNWDDRKFEIEKNRFTSNYIRQSKKVVSSFEDYFNKVNTMF